MKSGIELIAEERQRQIEVEGWAVGHDANHKEGQLALAGASYALAEQNRKAYKPEFLFAAICNIWPWSEKWWKPTPNDRVRELVKAGALMAAEIDRLQSK